jgi:hypothetical protein
MGLHGLLQGQLYSNILYVCLSKVSATENVLYMAITENIRVNGKAIRLDGTKGSILEGET